MNAFPRPDRDRLSILTALILLAYGLTRVVSLPSLISEFSLFGLLLRFELNTQFVMLSLTAVLAVSGVDWLLDSHSEIDESDIIYEHWIIPALAAVVFGVLLIRIPDGPSLWLGLVLSAGLLAGVLLAEFFAASGTDPRRDAATIGLRILGYLLLVQVIFSTRATGMRAAFAIPVIFVTVSAVSWRILRLSDLGQKSIYYGLIVGWVAAQIALGLHYWPIKPLQAGMLLGLLIYICNGFLILNERREMNFSQALEFGIVGGVSLIAILVLT